MFYTLSKAELDELTNKAKAVERELKDVIQDLCCRVANSEIITMNGWNKEIPKENQKPWKCSLRKVGKLTNYCDLCPVQSICPFTKKQWVK